MQDYQKLGEITSRKLQRRSKHLVTLKEVPATYGEGTRLIPKDYQEQNLEYAGFD